MLARPLPHGRGSDGRLNTLLEYYSAGWRCGGSGDGVLLVVELHDVGGNVGGFGGPQEGLRGIQDDGVGVLPGVFVMTVAILPLMSCMSWLSAACASSLRSWASRSKIFLAANSSPASRRASGSGRRDLRGGGRRWWRVGLQLFDRRFAVAKVGLHERRPCARPEC